MLKKMLSAALLPFLITNPGHAAPSESGLVQGLNAFALKIYKQLGSEKGNVVLSPFSISSAMAAAYAGARGETATEIAAALEYNGTPADLLAHWGELQTLVRSDERFSLEAANAMFTEKSFSFLPEYLALVTPALGSQVRQLDFKNQSEQARMEVNAWVAEKTHDKILDLIQPGDFDSATRLAIVNALYFRAAWEDPFTKHFTKEEPFFLSEGGTETVPLMNKTFHVPYYEDQNMQAVDLAYDADVSMTVLLPRDKNGLKALENKLPETLSKLSSFPPGQKVQVFLPRFKTLQNVELSKVLEKLGIKNAFMFGPADFSGIDGSRLLYISTVRHQAMVNVDESGTEAAAATALGMRAGASIQLTPPPPPPVFRADHPFIFILRHIPTKAILFIGRFEEP